MLAKLRDHRSPFTMESLTQACNVNVKKSYSFDCGYMTTAKLETDMYNLVRKGSLGLTDGLMLRCFSYLYSMYMYPELEIFVVIYFIFFCVNFPCKVICHFEKNGAFYSVE